LSISCAYAVIGGETGHASGAARALALCGVFVALGSARRARRRRR
jgi:hypothetical protein